MTEVIDCYQPQSVLIDGEVWVPPSVIDLRAEGRVIDSYDHGLVVDKAVEAVADPSPTELVFMFHGADTQERVPSGDPVARHLRRMARRPLRRHFLTAAAA